MKFKINGMTWSILLKPGQELLDKYNSEHEEKAYYTFGVTLYPIHEIWINKDMCAEQQVKTLKHELAHCYIWCYGIYNVLNFSEENVCDLISSSNEFINEVVAKFRKELM